MQSNRRYSLANGVKYLIQAFDVSTGNIKDYKVNTIGQPIIPLKLDGGKKYNIIVYSFGSTETPPRVSNINDKISYNQNSNRKEYLYHKINNYFANGNSSHSLDIVLKHKFSQIKFVLDTKSLSTHKDKGSSVNDKPIISNVYYRGQINVNNGNFVGTNTQNTTLSMDKVSKDLHESDYIPILGESSGNKNSFYVKIVAPAQYGDQEKTIETPITLQPGKKYTYKVKVRGVAYLPPKCTDEKAYNYGEHEDCKYLSVKITEFPILYMINASADEPVLPRDESFEFYFKIDGVSPNDLNSLYRIKVVAIGAGFSDNKPIFDQRIIPVDITSEGTISHTKNNVYEFAGVYRYKTWMCTGRSFIHFPRYSVEVQIISNVTEKTLSNDVIQRSLQQNGWEGRCKG